MKNTNWKYTLNVLCRWIVGLVFIFSSFVKGVDPMGTSFKVQEYMTAWSVGSLTFEWALPLATPLAVALVSAEFLVGVLLLTNSFRRFSAWLLALMMLFFTCTTLIDAITNKVTDCGCFGDAVKLTNWQTFWKNIALDIPTVWIFLTRNLNRRRRSNAMPSSSSLPPPQWLPSPSTMSSTSPSSISAPGRSALRWSTPIPPSPSRVL